MTDQPFGRVRAKVAMGALGIALLATVAHADQTDCEADARAAMLDVDHPVAMRQDVTTQMGDNTIASSALTTPGRRGMTLDADDTPVSLWIGGRFYTSTDGGESWTLLREQSPEELEMQAANLRRQAEDATDIACDYDIDLDGRTVHWFEAQYMLIGAEIPVRSQYWIDAATGFPWRVIHEFGGANPSVITQNNTPMPDLVIDDPG